MLSEDARCKDPWRREMNFANPVTTLISGKPPP
jgi:hypothetical protein